MGKHYMAGEIHFSKSGVREYKNVGPHGWSTIVFQT